MVRAAGAGSVIVIIATDAPWLPGQCKALTRRAPLGLARTGTAGSHFSGDVFLAFSTANQDALASNFTTRSGGGDCATMRFLPWNRMDPFYEAVVQATEEAVINTLAGAETTIGVDDHRSPGMPGELISALLDQAGRGSRRREPL